MTSTMQKFIWFVVGALVATLCIYWYLDEIRPGMAQTQTATSTQAAGIANPASTNCITLGGTLDITDTAEGQVGYCHLSDGRVCEEWSLFRGGCMAPAGQ